MEKHEHKYKLADTISEVNNYGKSNAKWCDFYIVICERCGKVLKVNNDEVEIKS
jgi:lysyl-tRNA synthetase class I